MVQEREGPLWGYMREKTDPVNTESVHQSKD